MKRATFLIFVAAFILVPFSEVLVAGDLDVKLDEPVSPEVLSKFKKQMQQGYNLQYFVFDPKHPRYKKKHGTSGDELMARIAEANKQRFQYRIFLKFLASGRCSRYNSRR